MSGQPTLSILILDRIVPAGTICDIVNELHEVNATVSPGGGAITYLAASLPGEPRRLKVSDREGNTYIGTVDTDPDTSSILNTIQSAVGGYRESKGPAGLTQHRETGGSISRNLV